MQYSASSLSVSYHVRVMLLLLKVMVPIELWQ